jgi:hypothetical protein
MDSGRNEIRENKAEPNVEMEWRGRREAVETVFAGHCDLGHVGRPMVFHTRQEGSSTPRATIETGTCKVSANMGPLRF